MLHFYIVSQTGSQFYCEVFRVPGRQFSLTDSFGYCDIFRSLQTMVDGSLQTILLCIVGELAGGGSVAVAVGVSDM